MKNFKFRAACAKAASKAAVILIASLTLFTVCKGVGEGAVEALQPELPEFKLYIAVNETKKLSPEEIARTASVPDSEGNISSAQGTVIAKIANGEITGLAGGAKFLPLLNMIIFVTPENAKEVIAMPSASPEMGEVEVNTVISLFCSTPGAEIYYTINGGDPTTESTKYSDDDTPVITAATTLKAIAVKDGMDNSEVLATAYYVKVVDTPTPTPTPPEQVAVPTASPSMGEVELNAKITLSAIPADADIFYTTNGAIPNADSEKYSPTNQPTITEATTLKAIAIKDSMISSTILTTAYYITPEILQQVAPPTVLPTAGAVTSNTVINLSSATEGAAIFYTTGSGIPDILYSESSKPIIRMATTFKAIAVKAGMAESAVMTAAYTVSGGSGAPAGDGFVWIRDGTFMMGSPTSEASRNTDEIQHQVTVGGFYMGIHEVTQKEYKALIGSLPVNVDDAHGEGIDYPVYNVRWLDAVNYCNARSVNEDLTPAYTVSGAEVTINRGANGYRLPTEAEWEYACRAGTVTTFNKDDTITTAQANYDHSVNKTAEVGGYVPNPWGLYDMHGNVSEWCWDWYGDYSTGAQTDPNGAASGVSRVIRGGSWEDEAQSLRSAFRNSASPQAYSSYRVGFRLVRY
jgi:formylglycine-generating enzyme required for sulfatase activity